MSKVHELKTDPEVFDASFWGIRDYEIRFDDRGFKVGDKLLLRETEFSGEEMKSGKPLRFTGREMTRTVCHILTGYGLKDGWVILACNPKEQVTDLRRELEQAQARIGEYERCFNLMTGIPASVGISEPVEGYAKQPEMAVTVMTLMSDLIAHSNKPVKEIEARSVENFVNGLVAAFDAGFVHTENLNLAQLHRVMQNHVKDTYQIEVPHIKEQWGDDTANACGFDVSNNKLRQQGGQ